MHEMSKISNDEKAKHLLIKKIQTENLRVKNPNSLDKIQHYGNTADIKKMEKEKLVKWCSKIRLKLQVNTPKFATKSMFKLTQFTLLHDKHFCAK